MSPQVLKGIYTSQSDLWAVGVIAYMLLSSKKPFNSRNRRDMMDLIMEANVSFDSPVWFFHISANAKDFVQKLLLKDPDQRLNAQDASNHPWITGREQLPDEMPSPEVLGAIDDCLINYQNTSQLKKLALIVIAHRSSTKDILELRKVFDTFDTKKDGTLSAKEFKDALLSNNFPESEINSVFAAIVRFDVYVKCVDVFVYIWCGQFFWRFKLTRTLRFFSPRGIGRTSITMVRLIILNSWRQQLKHLVISKKIVFRKHLIGLTPKTTDLVSCSLIDCPYYTVY